MSTYLSIGLTGFDDPNRINVNAHKDCISACFYVGEVGCDGSVSVTLGQAAARELLVQLTAALAERG